MTLTHVLNAALLHSLWEDTLIAVVLFAVLGAWRQRTPTARYAASCVALALMAVLPILTPVVSDLGMATRESMVVSAPVERLAAANSNVVPAIYLTSGTSSQTGWLTYLQQWALPCWFVGVLLFSLRLIPSAMRTVTLTHRASRADDSIRAVVDRLRVRLGVIRRVDVLTGPDGDGPAAFGWIRPVILLPPATLMGLTSEQLEAILAHELAHIRRHDYLVNVLQLVVETLFFYHPAIWWASRRVRVERELCCDDIAVHSCGDALGYAQALTTLAQMMLRTPRIAVGATDGPFVLRIKRLLGITAREQRSSWVAVLAVALVVMSGMLNVAWMRLAAQRPASSQAGAAPGAGFEVASIKLNKSFVRGPVGCRGIDSKLQSALTLFTPRINTPSASVPLGRCVLTAARLNALMSIAFGMPLQRIAGFPQWEPSNRFTIEAKAEDPATTTEQQLLSMLQHFLTDQFRLTVHREMKDGPTYALVVANIGPKNLHPSEEAAESNIPQGTSLVFKGYSMQSLAEFFSTLPPVLRPVKDLTAINGRFDFSLDFSGSTPKDLGAGDLSSVPPDARRIVESKMAMAGWETIFSDVQQQLGLRFESSTGPIDTLIIDHAELPREQ